MNRLVSLDAFRGATVASMLLVNNPGTWSAIYWPLAHAPWHGWTPTDLIFPFFLFIVGITTELSRKEPVAILRRGALIIACGLLLHLFPRFDFENLRYMGVLQRIGIVYIVTALIARKASRKTMLAIVIAILLGYWAILSLGPLEPPEATIAAQTDRAILGEKHIWKQARTWDPEGPLSTIPAVGTALLGVLATGRVKERNVKMLTIAGVIAMAIGQAWHLAFPINKNLWTSSYVAFTAGAASVLLALFIWIIDMRGAKRWAMPFVVFGVNPLIAFLGSGLMARMFGIWGVQRASYRAYFKPFFEPHLSSFLWALAFVALWLAILTLLYRRNIILKV
jgi:predicted acyltransferase